MYLFIVHDEMRLKEGISNHSLMVRLDLSLNDAKNCGKTSVFEKELSMWHISKDFYLKNPNNLLNLEQLKPVKVLEKYRKVEVVVNFK